VGGAAPGFEIWTLEDLVTVTTVFKVPEKATDHQTDRKFNPASAIEGKTLFLAEENESVIGGRTHKGFRA